MPGRSFPAVGTRSSGKVMFCGDSLRQWDEKEPPPNRQRLLHIDKDGRGHQREETDITDRPVPHLDAAIMPVNLTFPFAAITLAARSLTSLISVTSPRTIVRISVPHC